MPMKAIESRVPTVIRNGMLEKKRSFFVHVQAKVLAPRCDGVLKRDVQLTSCNSARRCRRGDTASESLIPDGLIW